jgi:hypothetical protein
MDEYEDTEYEKKGKDCSEHSKKISNLNDQR